MIEINVNSYVSLEEANEYFAQRLGADYWASLDDEQKEKALITATKKIDRLPFIGSKKDPAQPLQFPRIPLGQNVPQAIKDAVCEEALTELQFLNANDEDVYNGALTGNYQSLKLGDATITYGSTAGSQSGQTNYNGIMSKNAAELLQGYIQVGFNIASPIFTEVY